MSAAPSSTNETLEAKSPFELRLNQSGAAEESFIKRSVESGDVGFLHSFTTGSAVDGPGVRVVAWTAGCNWRCRYCHNPDTWSMINGMAVPLERAAEEVRKYRRGLKVMTGGLTISGGEPLLQDRFVVRLLTEAKKSGIHTAIETNGFLGERLSDSDLDQLDLVLLGLKSWGERHRDLTGKEMTPTLDFARRLASKKKPIWVRFVLVPGLTDDEDNRRLHRRVRRGIRERRTLGSTAVPPARPLQVGKARARLHAPRRVAPVQGTRGSDRRPIPELWT